MLSTAALIETEPAAAAGQLTTAASGATKRTSWVHPGVFQRSSDLDFMKAQVLARKEPWISAWNRMLAQPTSSLEFMPEPVTHIVRGSYGAGQVGDREINASLDAAQSHTLQWIVTGRVEHAQKAASIVDAWSSRLADFSGNDAMLLAGWTGGRWADTAEILKATWRGWPEASVRLCERMFRTVYVPLLERFFPEANGNWDAAMMHSLLGIAVFCEDRPLFDRVVAHYRYGPCSSSIVRYVYPSGQCEESARDQAHTQLGLGYFARTSLIAWNQGVDLFGEAANRLALGFEYTARYMLGEQVYAYGTISPQSRERLDDWYELPLQHFQNDRGIAMPYTERAAARVRERSRTVLTMARAARTTPLREPAPQPSRIALEAGATVRPADSSAVKVLKPGDSIQAAVDEAASAGGGVVQLSGGLFTLSEPLKMRSGVSLAGVGRDTVLYLDVKKQGAAVVHGDVELHDVTFRNFLIEAGPLAVPTRDPNQDRRPLAMQLVPGRGGIALIGEKQGSFRRITFERVSIRNATQSAVEIYGGDEISVKACDFSFNGGAVAPGEGKHHCLKLTQVTHGEITGSRLVDSLQGCGVAIAFGKAIAIQDCELARNAVDGVRLSECDDITVRQCLIEGNRHLGIHDAVWMNRNTRIRLSENLLQNNGSPSLG